MNDQVFVVQTEPRYPEFPYASTETDLARALKSLFSLWGKDPANPFADWIRPGGCALIKPNWVLDSHPFGHTLDCLITHSSLLKYVIDLLAVALDGRGRIIIGDAPIQGCDFARLVHSSKAHEAVMNARKRHPGIEILIEDWRLTVFETNGGTRTWLNSGAQRTLDEGGRSQSDTHQVVDLAEESFLEDIVEHSDRFRVSMYKPSVMAKHHQRGKHEYLVTKRIFEADLIINLPKMKTHAKAGLTGALKNLVGINGHKEYLPHHMKGSYFSGGDGYCSPNRLRRYYDDLEDHLWENYSVLSAWQRQTYAFALKVLWKLSRLSGDAGIASGSWSGNETIWRMTLDLNHILYFYKPSPRNVITLVDGVIAGEGEGPLLPTAKPAGLLIGGENPAHIDAVLAKFIGYNVSRVPTVYHALYNRKSKFGGRRVERLEVKCLFAGCAPAVVPFHDLPNLAFVKPRYWTRAETLPAQEPRVSRQLKPAA